MFLREMFDKPVVEAGGKEVSFALGRLNPATKGHGLLVEALKQGPGDAILFLTDRVAKLPSDPLQAQEKLGPASGGLLEELANPKFSGLSFDRAPFKEISFTAYVLKAFN